MANSLLVKLLITMLVLVGMAYAQSTAVTLTTSDGDAQTWNNGTWQVQLVPSPGNPASPFFIAGTNGSVPNQVQGGGLSSSGTATFTLTPNASISPAASIWRFVVCPNASTDCYRQEVTIAGATQTVALTPPAIRINATQMPPNAIAYQDIEISNPSVGAQYFNVTTLIQRQWNGVAWISVGGGSGTVNISTTGAEAYYPGNGNTVAGDVCTTDGAGHETCVTLSTSGVGTGQISMLEGGPPSPPAPGHILLFGDNTQTGESLGCLISSGGVCNFIGQSFASQGSTTYAGLTVWPAGTTTATQSPCHHSISNNSGWWLSANGNFTALCGDKTGTYAGPITTEPTSYSVLTATWPCNATYEGTRATLTDALSTSQGTTVTVGGGTNHVGVYCNGTNYVIDSGSASAPNGTFWGQALGSGSSAGAVSANTTKLWAINPPNTLTNGHIAWDIQTADNSANLYDIGIYNSSGTLLCDIGATAGTTFANATGIHTSAYAASCSTTLTGGNLYFIGVTGNAATAILGGSSPYAGYGCGVTPSAGSGTSGGALNASLTPPAVSAGSCTEIQIMLW